MRNLTILPAAGQASRMRGMPKFLLPYDSSYETLIERHIRLSLDWAEIVVVPTRAEFAPMLVALGMPNDRVVISVIESETMSETVKSVASWFSFDRYVVVMPDTFFGGETPYQYLANSSAPLDLAAWKIRKNQAGKLGQVELDKDGNVIAHQDKTEGCLFRHSWGAMSFDRKLKDLIQVNQPHVGYIIDPALDMGLTVRARVFRGEYFDCGTPKEYFEMIGSKYVAGSAGR